MQFTAVVFDLGGVVMPTALDGLLAYERELGLPEHGLVGFLRGDPVFARWQVGEATPEEFFSHVRHQVRARHGAELDVERLAAATEIGSVMDPEMDGLLHELHGRVALGLLTNNVRESVRWREEIPDELFDVVVDSSHVGMAKPDRRIYEHVLALLERPGEEVVFVDDWEENLPPARALGMEVVHFRDPAACRATLTDLGLLPTGPGVVPQPRKP